MNKKLKMISFLLIVALSVSNISLSVYANDNESIQQETQGAEKEPPNMQPLKETVQNDNAIVENEAGIPVTKSNATPNADSDFDFNPATGVITKYKGSRTDVVIPDTINGTAVVGIGETAFNFNRYGRPVDSIILPGSLKSIGDMAFQGQKFQKIVFPEGLESIGETAFLNCKNLDEVILPDSLTTLGRAAFKQCPAIRKVVLSANLKYIPNDCFNPVNPPGSLEEVVFKEGLEEIGDSAFMSQRLKNIKLPDSIKIIDRQAFASQQDKALHGNIYIGSSIQEIRAQNVGWIGNAFSGWSGKIIFPFTEEEATKRGVNAVLTYPGSPYKLGYSSTVKYETNGGTPDVIPSETVSYGELIKNIPTTITKAGYSFSGWYQDADFTAPWDFANDTVAADMTLYAKWVPKEYTVKYDTQGAEPIPDKTGVLFTENGLLPADPVKTGYLFKGWMSGNTYVTTDTTYNSLVNSDSDMSITLAAQWVPKEYTVKYDTQGAEPIPDKTGVLFTEDGLLPADPEKAGYLFKGWMSGNTFVTTDTTYNSLVNSDSDMSVTLTAQWEITKLNVHYVFTSPDNPEGISVPEDVTINYGSSIGEPTFNVPKNWTFDGWYLDKELTQKFDFTKPVTSDTTLYGKWTYKKPMEPMKPTEPIKPGKPSLPSKPDTTITPTAKPNMTATSVKKPKAPQTGDTKNTEMWMILLLGSIVLLSIELKRRIKRLN